MKLSPEVIEKIMEHYHYIVSYDYDDDAPYKFKEFLKTLDLVVHDSSQSTLVENK